MSIIYIIYICLSPIFLFLLLFHVCMYSICMVLNNLILFYSVKGNLEYTHMVQKRVCIISLLLSLLYLTLFSPLVNDLIVCYGQQKSASGKK